MEDASLDRFADAASEAAESTADAQPSDGEPARPDDATDAPAGVDPASSTATWTPGGSACEACGATAERRWTAEAGLVCVDCVDW